MPDNFSSLIAHVTGGRRYCFVLMSYHEGFTFFEKLRKIVAEVTGFECIRADDLPGAGADLRLKIHSAIDNAVFVIGDVSEPRPNIYYELGYAIACNKPVILIKKEHAEIHTDLQGLEMINYTDNKLGWQFFEKSLRQHLNIHKDSNISLLRALVLPPNPQPSLIVINPKQPPTTPRISDHIREIKLTYGDYLGLSGIMGAYTTIYGEHIIPEIVNAASADNSIVDCDANLFLIGSPKVNKFTGILLESIQNGKPPYWRFEKCLSDPNEIDYEVRLIGKLLSGDFQTKCGSTRMERSVNFTDYGLIVRGRHPKMPERTVLILAGPHSVGTGSACLAATKPQLLQTISNKLLGKAELTDQKKTIWVLVKGISDNTGNLDVSNVNIEYAGVI
ncbi:MAG: hypothetical protein IQL11_12365 [Bacteroidales bacterium]|nr:hypothetical protein [Bacteroidales bacterium]